MNISIISAVCESLYYNGRVKAGSKKLDRRDFEQLAKAAHGTIMRKLYYELRLLEGELLYFADSIDTREFTIKVRGKDKYIEVTDQLMNMPYGLGIFGIFPISDGESSSKCQPFIKAQAGSDWLYCGSDFSSVPFYIKKGKRVFFYNNECLKEGDKVEVEGLFENDDKIDIPNDIAFDVINAVMGTALKVVGFPIDPTNDNNPNVIELKRRLADNGSI